MGLYTSALCFEGSKLACYSPRYADFHSLLPDCRLTLRTYLSALIILALARFLLVADARSEPNEG